MSDATRRPSSVRARSASVSGLRQSRLPVKVPDANFGKTSSRRTLEKKSQDKNFIRSRSTLDLPRLSRQRSASLLRTTPVQQNIARSGRKSPLSSGRKDVRPVSDKRWQYEQLVKVKNYVDAHFPELDHNSIKSGMPLDMFIKLTHAYFQIIDKRIHISKENYIEEVPSTLRMVNYPSSVKPSLLKTVNTMHSWPFVIAIFSWLTDIVMEIRDKEEREETLTNIAENCITQLYSLWTEERDEYNEPIVVFDAKLVKYFEIDEKELVNLEEEIKILEKSNVEYNITNEKNAREMENLRQEIELITNKCISFISASEKYSEEISMKIASLTKKIKKSDEQLEELLITEDNLKVTLANQSHTLVDKEMLMKDIQELQNTMKLKEERYRQQKDSVHVFDHQLTELKEKIEADAYHYNNIIRKLEIVDPTFVQLHIRESGFVRSDTQEVLQQVEKLLNATICKLEKKLDVCRANLADVTQKNKLVEDECLRVDNELQELIKIDAELEYTDKHQITKLTSEIQSIQDKANILRSQLLHHQSKRTNIVELEKEVEHLTQLYDAIFKENEEQKLRALQFFAKLDEQISNNILNYMQIMEDVSQSVATTQEKFIEDSKNRVAMFKKAQEDLDKD